MSRQSPVTKRGYEIQIRGYLNPKRLSWFEGVTVTLLPEGTTLITMAENDQTSLHALLNALSDFGVTLVSVVPVIESQEADGD